MPVVFWVQNFLCDLALIISRLYFAVGRGQVVEAVSVRACAHANFNWSGEIFDTACGIKIIVVAFFCSNNGISVVQ